MRGGDVKRKTGGIKGGENGESWAEGVRIEKRSGRGKKGIRKNIKYAMKLFIPYSALQETQ